MLRLLISLLIQLFFRRPSGIAPGQKAHDIDAALERLEEAYCAAHGKRYRRPPARPPQPSFDLAPDLDFSL
jgi:hypothetical protein